MPSGVLRCYVEQLPAQHAQRQIAAAEVVLLPHLKDTARQRAMRRWQRRSGAGRQPTSTFFSQLARHVKVKEVPRG